MIVRALTTCHTHSPDATPCDFFLWGYVKDQVYVPPLPTSIPELKVSPLKPSPLTCYELDYHVGVHRITKGAHIEHL